MRFILASASPRRAELLRAAGFDFDVVPTDVDEQRRDTESPRELVRRLAAEKSAAAMRLLGQKTAPIDNLVVLGADTVVVLDEQVLGKPVDRADAARMLRELSGRRHEVLTGISLRAGSAEVGRVETTLVEFAELDEAELGWYVASGEGLDKAGAYAIQGRASRFIPRIEGSYSNVVGLPVRAVFELLTEIASGRYSGYSGR